MVGQKNMIKRLRNVNTSPTRGGDDKKDNNIDDDTNTKSPTCDPCQSNSSISVHSKTSQDSARSVQTSGSRRSSHTNGVNGRNDAMLRIVAIMEQRDRRQEQRLAEERQRQDERDRRQEKIMAEDRRMFMQLIIGRQGPQVTVAVIPPKPFYGEEDKDMVDFDEWIATVNEYVQRSGMDALVTLKNALEGPARDAFHSIPVEQRQTYDDAVDRLKPLVRPVMSKNVAAIKVLNLQSAEDEDQRVFLQRYLKLHNKTTTHHIQRASYIQALPPKLKERILIKLTPERDAWTLRQVQELVITESQIMNDARNATKDENDNKSETGSEGEEEWKTVRHKKSSYNTRPIRNGKSVCKTHPRGSHGDDECNTQYCDNHKMKGHSTNQCYMYVRCYNCGEMGHQSGRCTKMKGIRRVGIQQDTEMCDSAKGMEVKYIRSAIVKDIPKKEQPSVNTKNDTSWIQPHPADTDDAYYLETKCEDGRIYHIYAPKTIHQRGGE